MIQTLSIILVVLVLGLAFFVFLKLLKTVFKAMFAVLLLVIFVLAVFGIVMYIDYTKLKGNFDEDQTIILTHKGTVAAGFVFSNDKDTQVLESQKIQLLSKEEISQINEDIINDDYKKTSENGLTIVFDSSYLDGKSVELLEGTSIVLNETLIDSVFSCTKLSSCTALLVTAAPDIKKQIDSSFDDAQDVKNKLFFSLFVQETKATKGAFIVTGIKEDTVTVYPELLTLKMIKMLPEKMIEKVFRTRFEEGASADELNETANE